MYSVTTIVLFFVLVNSISGKSRDTPKICADVISRERWGGRTPIAVDYAIVPVKFVIIHHTVTPECTTERSCASVVKSIQDFHMEELEFHDVGYNFLVGGDGQIYEGSGWHKVGAHTRGYNSRSLGLAFIGDFSRKRPSSVQIKAAKDFLKCAVELRELHEDYKLFGARQVSQTASPGLYLYTEIKDWPNFNSSP
ncbi:unnamed protein product [Psylliodes chrysocephalus]|uniref:Peptidoglycan-recognition protein n=1 Tax=Psylliodes chrysocephalus TaxID=3402493 RepID=A0A9P0D1I8_9CUCU|nr:unnamed protein product [Psylliodes chrysocephala]